MGTQRAVSDDVSSTLYLLRPASSASTAAVTSWSLNAPMMVTGLVSCPVSTFDRIRTATSSTPVIAVSAPSRAFLSSSLAMPLTLNTIDDESSRCVLSPGLEEVFRLDVMFLALEGSVGRKVDPDRPIFIKFFPDDLRDLAVHVSVLREPNDFAPDALLGGNLVRSIAASSSAITALASASA
eukprot:CAMPEP_0181217258 /NCGR_PEP_ID=MMETSP1096-20121128/27051_1 /TAXON_ID=156174 ORGANISM="Chrysochromulina ericina, Strain CCMP281" /NCGR_SAMPLE_ID=MMETSP1096 /ASSEMBLY_ACC=CAM_ASM_000453 /LENGTH=181 /DNA_ID=CAMNT_0023309369 /DNA_START=585 /DNA_END=1130 /DNA_ORIENTATION=+